MKGASDPDPRVEWRGPFDNAELNSLHAQGFGHSIGDEDWWRQVSRHSLGWVSARSAGELVGFANVAWDGGVHAFLLDVLVRAGQRRQGLGARLVAAAVEGARDAGCEWLHVDFEPRLRRFYLEACGFSSADAGTIALRHG
ncbi:MAG: GNAT family N-acetyltransferase [Caulobacteraceae bacterium]